MMQGAPMRHRGEHVGHVFVGDKAEGATFTAEDEEILVLFASQPDAAIANARTHRDLERERADLAALFETSPVGVVVFETGRGWVASVNLEALRIVEETRTPGSPPEQLLEVVTCRRSDGREMSLAELPPAEMLKFFRLINGQADHMRGLIADLLDAGSIGVGTLEVALEPTSVASLADRAWTTFLSGGSRFPVLVELRPGLPSAMADRERIVQVLNNFFSNWARYPAQRAPAPVP